MKIFRLFIHIALATSILIAPFFVWAQQQRSLGEAIQLAQNNLFSQQASDGSIGDADTSDWAAMALVAAGAGDSRLEKLRSFVMAAAKRVDKNSATELERTILALTAFNQSPYDVGGRNLVNELKALGSAGQIGSSNQLNDDIFGVLALRASGQDLNAEPAKSSIEFIKRNQLANGGFNDRVGASQADIDITAAAVMALQPVADTTAARNLLTSAQGSDGGFPSRLNNPSNTASTAWVTWALGATAASSGTTSFEFLVSKQAADGSIGSILTTAYALQALSQRSLPIGFVAAPIEPQPAPPVQSTTTQTTEQTPQNINPAPSNPSPVTPEPTPAPAPVQPTIAPELLAPAAPASAIPSQPKSVVRGIRSTSPVKKQPKRKTPSRVDQPITAGFTAGATYLVTSATYPKETLATFEAPVQSITAPNLGQQRTSRDRTTAIILIIFAIGLLTNTAAIFALWQRLDRLTHLEAPPV